MPTPARLGTDLGPVSAVMIKDEIRWRVDGRGIIRTRSLEGLEGRRVP